MNGVTGFHKRENEFLLDMIHDALHLAVKTFISHVAPVMIINIRPWTPLLIFLSVMTLPDGTWNALKRHRKT